MIFSNDQFRYFVLVFCPGSLVLCLWFVLYSTRYFEHQRSKTPRLHFACAAYINPAVCFHSPRPVLSAVVDLPAVPQATIGNVATFRVPPPYFVVALPPSPDRERQSRFAWAG